MAERFRLGGDHAFREDLAFALGALVEAVGQTGLDGVDRGKRRPEPFRGFRERLAQRGACVEA